MAQQQSDSNTEKWDFFLQYYHKQIRKSQKLGFVLSFMSNIREKLTFVIMGHYDCRKSILAIKNFK